MTAIFKRALPLAAALGMMLPLSEAAVGDSAAVPPSPPVKWYPGHYVFIGHNKLGEGHIVPHFRGVQKCYTWKTLEPQKGRYDFSLIKADLAFLKQHDRRLVIQLQYKAFNKGSRYVPDYLQGPEYGGGVYRAVTGSFNPVLWNENVGERLDALIAALGHEFDRESHLEAVNLPETAPSANFRRDPQPGIEPYSPEKYLDSLQRRMRTLRAAFPNTVVIQYANFPLDRLAALTDFMKGIGVGLGGPDVYPFDTALSTPGKGVYHYYPLLAGLVPLGAAVQSPDYSPGHKQRTKAFDSGKDPKSVVIDPKDDMPIPPRDLFRFARDKLRLNYLFWSTHPRECFDNVRKWMGTDEFPKDPAGGLDARLPKKAFAPAANTPSER